MSNVLQLPDLPLMLAGTPRPVEDLLREAGVPVESLPEVPLAAAGTGRFVLYDSQNSRSAARARRAELHGLTRVDIRGLLPPGEEVSRLALDQVTEERLAEESAVVRAFLDRLKLTIEHLGGAWVRIGDYPFPYQSAIAIGIEHLSEELSDFAGIAQALPQLATHFVSSRLRADRLAFLAEAGPVDLGWQIAADEREDSARRTLSHWTTRQGRFAEVRLQPAGFAVTGDWANVPGTKALQDLGLAYACQQSPGIACRAVTRARATADERPWIRFSTRALPPPEKFLEWVSEHYQSGCPLFLTTHTERLDLVQELLRLAGDAQRCSLMWRTSFGVFARWWALRRQLKLRVWRTDVGHEIQVTGDFGPFAWSVEVWRGQHRATLPLRTPVLTVSDNGLVYSLSSRRTPAGGITPGDQVRNLVAHAGQAWPGEPCFVANRFRRKGSLE